MCEPMELEKSSVQETLKSAAQRREIRERVVVADGLTSNFPDMLLRIQVRTSRWEIDHLQTGLSGNEILNEVRLVPRGAIH